jgi:cell wall-associated NlpC family hydrolase
MEAYAHIGIYLPRTTYEMLGSEMLRQVTHPMRGDLAFYGPGHVELVTKRYHQTFGAHDSGSQIGYIRWSPSWYPTAYYAVQVPTDWRPGRAR